MEQNNHNSGQASEASNQAPSRHLQPNEHQVSLPSLPPKPVKTTITLGKYHLEKRIGRGGMGEIWKAQGPFNHLVAVKVLRGGVLSDKDSLARFRKEAQAMSKLQHRNICRILDVGESLGLEGPTAYIAMELLEGVNLAEILDYSAHSSMSTDSKPGSSNQPSSLSDLSTIVKSVKSYQNLEETSSTKPSPGPSGEPLPVQLSLAVILKICEAIQFAHEKGIFHRDLKPANIFIREDGEPVILDFGLAKVKSHNDVHSMSLSHAGDVFGTFEYMAPEQAQSSKDVDERSDLYALAAILYQMLTGRKSFQSSGHVLKDIQRLQMHEPVKPCLLNPRLDKELQSILLKALQAEPQARYVSVQQFADDIQRYLRGETILAKKMGITSRVKKFAKRHKVSVTYSSVILFISIAFLSYFIWEYQKHWGSWSSVYTWDHRQVSPNHDFAVYDAFLSKQEKLFNQDSSGLLLKKMNWLQIVPIDITGDIRVICRIKTSHRLDAFEIAINAAVAPLDNMYAVPTSYSFQIGGYLGKTDFATVNHQSKIPVWLKSAATKMQPNQELEIQVERIGETFSLTVNREKTVETQNLLPLHSPRNNSVLLRSMADSVHLLSLQIYRMSMPEKTSPLVAGEVMASYGFTDAAINYFEHIGNDYKGHDIAVSALVKAYLIESGKKPLETEKEKAIYQIITKQYPNSPYRLSAVEAYTVKCLNAGRTDEALDNLQRVLQDKPSSLLPLEFLSPAYSDSLTPARLNRLLPLLNGLPSIPRLSANLKKGINFHLLTNSNVGEFLLTNCNLSDITFINSKTLHSLHIGQNYEVSNFQVLKDKRLRLLDLGQTQFREWKMLNGMPLVELGINKMGLNKFPLPDAKHFPLLEIVSLSHNPMTNLKGLETFNLRRLTATSCKLDDISALRGMSKLDILLLPDNNIKDLSPLKGLKISNLDVSQNEITSLDDIAGERLKTLMANNSQIVSMPKTFFPVLKKLALKRSQIKDLKFLRQMLKLEYLTLSNSSLTSLQGLESVRLRTLDISGSPIKNYEALRSQGSLEWIRLNNTSFSNLKSLDSPDMLTIEARKTKLSSLAGIDRFKHLKELSIGHTQVKHLTLVQTLPLISLNIEFTNTTGIESLAQVHTLKKLIAPNAKLRDLRPLNHLDSLALVNIDNNPVKYWMQQPWPETTFFYNCGLNEIELDRLIKQWMPIEKMEQNRRRAEIYKIWKTGNFPDLRRVAQAQVDGTRLLFIPIEVSYRQAKWIAEKSHGHLARLSLSTTLRNLSDLGEPKSAGWVSEDIFDQLKDPDNYTRNNHIFVDKKLVNTQACVDFGMLVRCREDALQTLVLQWDK